MRTTTLTHSSDFGSGGLGGIFSGFKVGNGTAPMYLPYTQLRLYLRRDYRYPISPTIIVHRTPYTQHGRRSNPVPEDENIWKLFRGGYTALLFTAGDRLLRARISLFFRTYPIKRRAYVRNIH